MESDQERYRAACHAMQSGVALMMNYAKESTDPKHLRVGINSEMVSNAALVELLISKGIITLDEFDKALADGMEKEVARYTELIKDQLGKDVTLV